MGNEGQVKERKFQINFDHAVHTDTVYVRHLSFDIGSRSDRILCLPRPIC